MSLGMQEPQEATAPPDGPSGSPWINPRTRDYELDPDTRQLKQMPELRQRVYLKLGTRRGSMLSDPTFGIELPKKIGLTFDDELRANINTAFARETQIDKIMRIDGIKIENTQTGRVAVTLSYTDLNTEQPDEVGRII